MNRATPNQPATQERTRREILHKSDLIPPLPDLVVRLLATLNRHDTEPRHLEALMQNDQVLVARLLAIVNSPFYGMSRSISTIREAVMMLGFRGVRSLVLAASTAKFLQRDYSCYGYEVKGLWLHAASVAAGARSIARACRLPTAAAEQLFVAGLLHDIGKLLLAPYLQDKGCVVGSGRPVTEVERELVGIDHTEAGALVTAKWSLDTEIQEVIKRHHDTPTSDDVSPPASIVRLANAIAEDSGIGCPVDRVSSGRVHRGDLDALGLDEGAWAVLRDEVAVHMEEGASALLDLGG